MNGFKKFNGSDLQPVLGKPIWTPDRKKRHGACFKEQNVHSGGLSFPLELMCHSWRYNRGLTFDTDEKDETL